MSRFLVGPFIAASLLLLAAAAAAQSRATFVPSVSLGSVYDDNLFARTVGSGDQMTTLTPGIEAWYEAPTTNLMALYSFDMQRSIDHPALNNLEARRRALFDTRFQMRPRLALGLGGRYDRTDTAGDLNVTTGLLLDRVRAVRWQAGPSITYQASARTTVSAAYDWTKEGVDGSPSQDEHVARLGLMRQISPRSAAGVSYLGRHFVYGVGARTSNAGLFDWTYELAPATMFRLQAGPRSSAQGGLAPEIVIALGRRVPDRFGYAIDYWRGESITLGVLGPVEVHSVAGKVTWPIRRKAEVGLHGGIFDSATLTQGRARVYHAEIVTAWSPIGPLVIAASYGADFQRGDVRTSLLAEKQVVRHIFLLRLTAAPRVNRSFKPEDPLQPLGEPSKSKP